MVLFSLIWSMGCADTNSCKTYMDAAADCATSAGADPTPYDANVVCGNWTDADEATYGDWYSCRAEAIDAGDCSSAEGLDAALIAAESCEQPA